MHTQIMNFFNTLIFFSLFHSLIIINSAYSKCPDSFQCGDLGTLQFPLYHISNPRCGLFMVDQCHSESPKIQFGARSNWYDILEYISTNKFLIRSPVLEEVLMNWNRDSCLLNSNLSLHQPPSASFTVSPNLTIFLCNEHDNERVPEYFKNYKRSTNCSAFTAYYNNSNSGVETGVPSAEGSDAIPPECRMIQLPRKPNNNHSGGLYDLLTSEFVVEWDVSKPCYECHHGGGQCLTDNMNQFLRCQKGSSSKRFFFLGGVASLLTCTSIILFLLIWNGFKRFRLGIFQDPNPKNRKDIELFLRNNGILAQKRFKYSEIKKITKSFKECLGNGGYGSVYKGKLPDGRQIAVKMLHESKGNNGEEFINEVASISRTSHINVVTLLGFCFEGSKRALIYEFMPNGSLEKYIHNNSVVSPSLTIKGGLGWRKLFDIAVGIARGLEYLHQGCNTRILHFDIKPHNILLDNDFNPKISDFGLARMCPNRSSIVSMMGMRGTIGYIAPEVFSRNFGEVSHKSDVYSYGMMVLEIAGGGRKNIDRVDVDHTSDVYFPRYLYRELKMDGGDLDGTLNEDEGEFGYKRKLIIVGLWCIQTDPKDRPSMSKVVDMLEGKLESLQIPPKPYLSSPLRPPPNFSTSKSMYQPDSNCVILDV